MTTLLSPRENHVVHIHSLPDQIVWRIMRMVDFTSRRTCVPLVCKSWRDLARDASLWSDTLHVTFPTHPDNTDPKQFYTAFAASVTAWLTRTGASPAAVCVTHPPTPNREGAALLRLLHCLSWHVSSISLVNFPAVTVSSALRVLGKQQRLIGLRTMQLATLDMRHEHRLTGALAHYCASLVDLRLDVCELVDGHELLVGLSALTALSRLDVRVAGRTDEHDVLDQGVQVADMVWLRALTALQHLELHGVPLPCWPSALTSLQALTTVKLLHSAASFHVPQHACMRGLRALELCGGVNHEVLCNAPALTSLRLRRALLGEDDAALFGDLLRPLQLPTVLSTALRVLDLGYAGAVHGLSAKVLQTVAGCSRLQWLDVRRCRLTTLPEAWCRLRMLRYCWLRVVWRQAASLFIRHLDVSDNELQVLPPVLQHMGKLHTLIARECAALELTAACVLPPGLCVLDVTREGGWALDPLKETWSSRLGCTLVM